MNQPPMNSAERRVYNRRLFLRKRYEATLVRAGNPQSWIYVIGCDEVRVVKIGISSNPQSRLATMQTGSPVVLRLLWKTPGSLDMEQDLHEYFHTYRKHGEWFDFGDENPVAMVAGAAALLGYWRPPGKVTGLSPHVPSTDRDDALPGESLEIPRVILPPPFDAPRSEPIGPPPLPPLPPGLRPAEETP